MKGFIYLVRRADSRVVPALCVEEREESIRMAQIKKAVDRKLANGVYISKPKGLRAVSVVMAKNLFTVRKTDVVKQISKVKVEKADQCLALHQQMKNRTLLQRELKELKKKIYYAQLNNERYTDYEIRVDEIVVELGYPIKRKRKMDKAYLNYRETPHTGYIKIYHGGR